MILKIWVNFQKILTVVMKKLIIILSDLDLLVGKMEKLVTTILETIFFL